MVTAGEIISELESTLKKVEFLEVTYPGNDLWSKIQKDLKEIIVSIKSDIRMFGYD